MPYLKIKTSISEGQEWTTVNDLTLSTLTIENDGTIENGGTISGGSISNATITSVDSEENLTSKIEISNGYIRSVNKEENPTSKIEISGGQLKIGIGDNPKNLDDYLSLNTSGCTVGDENTPEDYKQWGEKSPKKGDLYIQIIDDYSLLWYHNGATAENNPWVRVNAIWG